MVADGITGRQALVELRMVTSSSVEEVQERVKS